MSAYKKGEFIGQKYEVYDVSGEGNFGIVYLVYSHEIKKFLALKTFKDKYLQDKENRERFKKEAQVWIKLGYHPFFVRAYWVDQIANRLYIGMEHIARNDQAINSLEGYIQKCPPTLVQSLHWAIQFCYGMEHAYSKGLRCHRDIKPDNILITQDKIVKISDFGLAGVIQLASHLSETKQGDKNYAEGSLVQTKKGDVFGFLTHMSPEQFIDASSCDKRSDIYSFGIVLYQMLSDGRPPFIAPKPKNNSLKEIENFSQRMKDLHCNEPPSEIDSPLFPIIKKCLEKKPGKRYQSFKELRAELEPLLLEKSGEIINPPKLKEYKSWEWNNRGVSLANLGRYGEAIKCYDEAIKLKQNSAAAWCNKGISLQNLNRYEEALNCYDEAIKLNPKYPKAWSNKGSVLSDLQRHEDALYCCDKATKLDIKFAPAWSNKGVVLGKLNRHEEAISCFAKAINLDKGNINAWLNKGTSLANIKSFEDAKECYDKVIEIDPYHATAWSNKGGVLANINCNIEALECCNKAISLAPKDSSIWSNKGSILNIVSRCDEALTCCEKALELDPKNAKAWNNKGTSLGKLGCFEDSICCFDKAISLDANDADSWSNKGFSLSRMNRYEEAIICYEKTLEIDPQHEIAKRNKEFAEKQLL